MHQINILYSNLKHLESILKLQAKNKKSDVELWNQITSSEEEICD